MEPKGQSDSMRSAREERAKMAAAEVLNGLYEAIADNSRFETMFKAMDDFLDTDPVDLERRDADWKQVFRTHFNRVSQYMETRPEDDLESPVVYVDRQLTPAAIINRSLEVIATNPMFDVLHPPTQTSIGPAISTPKGRRNLKKLFTENSESRPILLSLHWDEGARPVFVVAKREALSHVSGSSGPFVSIRVAKAVWNKEVAPLLEVAYDLTTAEAEVLRGLIETGSISQIARLRKRSVRTVRTQLANIFAKLNVSSQTELTLFLATLTQMMSQDRRLIDKGADAEAIAPAGTDMKVVKLSGRTVSYLIYGAPDGHPVLMLQPTTPPSQTAEFRKVCFDNNLRMIVPFKPGSGKTDRRPPEEGPEKLSRDYKAILDAEGVTSVTVAGHCSGGLYALEFSARYPDLIHGVVLVDTGAPFRGRPDLMALPPSLRRTFLPARYIPDVLLVPHRIIAANFRRSLSGEAKVVNYFFSDSDADAKLVRTDRRFYDITKRIIAYSFEDIDRLVADVCRWAQDWSGLFKRVSMHSIVFLHGRSNTLFTMDRIEDITSQYTNTATISVEEQGQLQLYICPENFADAVKLARERS